MTPTTELPLELKALIFWASNPEMVLSTEEVARKFFTTCNRVGVGLRQLCRRGLLVREEDPYGRKSYGTSYYKAGPTLFGELGGSA